MLNVSYGSLSYSTQFSLKLIFRVTSQKMWYHDPNRHPTFLFFFFIAINNLNVETLQVHGVGSTELRNKLNFNILNPPTSIHSTQLFRNIYL